MHYRNLLFTLTILLFSQVLQAQPRDYTLHLKSGNFVPKPGLLFEEAAFQPSYLQFDGKYYVVIQFLDHPSEEKRQRLANDGIKLLEYLPNFAWHVEVSANYKNWKSNPYQIRSLFALTADDKTDNRLKDASNKASWAIEGNMIHLRVQYLRGIEFNKIRERITQIPNIALVNASEKYHSLELKVPIAAIGSLGQEPWVQWLEPTHPPLMANNLPGKTLHRSKFIGSSIDRNLQGDSVNVGEWDGGYIGSHLDLNNHITILDSNVYSDHATHVAGTIAGNGNFNPFAEGMAPKAHIYSKDFFGDIVPGMDSNYIKYHLNITSNSYGYSPAFDPCPKGNYDGESQAIDHLSDSATNFLHVFAAGNSQGSCSFGGYRTIASGWNSAKNTLTVGAADYMGVMSGFSSWGPTVDGRLKPEITGMGVSVFSTLADNNYGTFNGTSMATPGVSGTTSQLYQRYRQLYHTDPDNALLKAVICNTADDGGNAHADYKFGYGILNALQAVKVLEDTNFHADTISNNSMHAYTFSVGANTNELRVMTAWADMEGNPSANKALVNDIDSWIITPSNDTIRPWMLDPNNPSNAAVRGIDTLNNMEQITIDSPAAGTYTLYINGTNIPSGAQKFWYNVYTVKPELIVTYPNGRETLTPGSTEQIRWYCTDQSSAFDINYSTDNGATWTLIASNVAAAQRYYTWSVPATETNEALVKVSNANFTDSSNQTFTIMGRPANMSATACDSSINLSWAATNNAASYLIYKMDQTFSNWNLLDSSSTNSYTANGLFNDTLYYFTVRARHANGFIGERATAIGATPQAISESIIASNKSGILLCGDSVTLTAVSANSYLWFPNGETSNAITTNMAGTYYVNVNYGGGCKLRSSDFNVSSGLVATISADTLCSGNDLVFTASSPQIYTARFTEISQNRSNTGATSPYPSWITGASASADYIEISNLGTDTLSIGNYSFELWGDSLLRTYNWPTWVSLLPDSLSILHIGNTATDDSAHLFFNTGGADDPSGSGSLRGYILKNATGKIIDVAATNGYIFPSSAAISNTDWTTDAPSIQGLSGMMLWGADNNRGDNWVASSAATKMTLGSVNLVLEYIPTATISWSYDAQTYTGDSIYISGATNSGSIICTLNTGSCTQTLIDTIVVLPTAVGGQITRLSDSVCAGSNGVYTLTNYTGQVAHWEMLDTNNNWVNISNTNSSISLAITRATSVRAYITSGYCTNAYSDTSTIYTKPTPTAGTLSANTDTLCQNELDTIFITGNSGTVQWEYRSLNGNWASSGVGGNIYPFMAIESRYYRALVSDNGCSSYTLDSILIIQYPTPVSGIIVSSKDTACLNDTLTLMASGAMYGTVSWEYDDSNSGNYKSLSLTGDTIQTIIMADTKYRLTVTSNQQCGSVNSAVKSITIATPIAGTISSLSSTLCQGNKTKLYTQNSLATSYNWQYDDNGTWTDLYQYDSVINIKPSQTTQYRVQAWLNGCGPVNSNTYTITITAPPTKGSLTIDPISICANDTAQIKLTGYSGGTLTWESFDPNAGQFVVLGQIGDSINVNPLTTTLYRGKISSASCGFIYTDTATLIVSAPSSLSSVILLKDTICPGSTAIFILGSHVGNIAWEKFDTGSGLWQSINVTDDTLFYPPTKATAIRATATSGVCPSVSTSSITVNLYDAAVAGIAASSFDSICVGDSITLGLFNFSGNVSWLADYGNGFGVVGSGTPINLKPTITVDYKAIVSVSNCSADTSNTINVLVNKLPVAGALTSLTQSICVGNYITLQEANYTGNISWEYYDSTFSQWIGISGAGNIDTVQVSPISTTTYRAKVYTSCGIDSTADYTIQVNPIASSGTIVASADSLCPASSIILKSTGYSGSPEWQAYDQSTSTYQTISVGIDSAIVTPTVNTYYRLVTYSNGCGIDSSAYYIVHVKPGGSAGLLTSSSNTVCVGSQAQLTLDTPIVGTIMWQEFDSIQNQWVNLTGKQNPKAVFPYTDTKYRALVSAAVGCDYISNEVIIQTQTSPLGNVAISGPTTLCEGSAVTLTASAGTNYTYQWQKDSINIVGATSKTYNSTTTGTYRVIVTNPGGCTTTSGSIAVTVNPAPAKPTITRVGNQLSSSVSSGNQWYLDGVQIAGANTQTITATANGSYIVKVTNTYNCSATSDALNFVGVKELVYIPEIKIYPNPSDGLFNIQINNAAQTNLKFTVTDLAGKVIIQQQAIQASAGLYQETIHLEGAAKGIYLLHISNGDYQTTLRICKL
jgi:hypothetical protein